MKGSTGGYNDAWSWTVQRGWSPGTGLETTAVETCINLHNEWNAGSVDGWIITWIREHVSNNVADRCILLYIKYSILYSIFQYITLFCSGIRVGWMTDWLYFVCSHLCHRWQEEELILKQAILIYGKNLLRCECQPLDSFFLLLWFFFKALGEVV